MCCGKCNNEKFNMHLDRYADGYEDGLRQGLKRALEHFRMGYNLGVEHAENKNLVEGGDFEKAAENYNRGHNDGHNDGYEDASNDYKESIQQVKDNLAEFFFEKGLDDNFTTQVFHIFNGYFYN